MIARLAPPLAWVGGLGYGVCLIHGPVSRCARPPRRAAGAAPGAFFVVTALLVGVPAVALAWLSSGTVEVAGIRLLATRDRDGSPRVYYHHLRDGPALSSAARARAGAPR
jgi:peptidoglycan/LPS O-acetylase OafA/YrhL